MATARAHSNIALAKYWGKKDTELNLPAVPSISMTLDAYHTTTTVEFDSSLAQDTLILNERTASQKELHRVQQLLNRVRTEGSVPHAARVISRNNFPTASGLASSASGFCALALAARAAVGLSTEPGRTSALARGASASAARSVFGGFAELPAGTRGQHHLKAKPLFGAKHWDLRLVVALTEQGPKAVGSTEGMENSRLTSPMYKGWVSRAPLLTRRVRSGLKHRNLSRLGEAMEKSTLWFHACTMSSTPPIIYWNGVTLTTMKRIVRLRTEEHVPVYFTMDAGPHVKALCESTHADRVAESLAKVPGVTGTCICGPGPAAALMEGDT